MYFHRHDLVYADWTSDTTDCIIHNEFKKLVKDGMIPGIVRREETAEPKHTTYYDNDEVVYVGFVYPHKINGMRMRYASQIRGDAITKKISPFDIVSLPYAKRTLSLRVLDSLSKSFILGVWGSAALEIATGLPYTDESSDLDIIVKDYNAINLLKLWNAVSDHEEKYSTRIDVEILLKSGYAINLKEYFKEDDLLLAKGLRDVVLIEKESIVEFYETC